MGRFAIKYFNVELTILCYIVDRRLLRGYGSASPIITNQ